MERSPDLDEEPFVHLADARVVLVNYELLLLSVPLLGKKYSFESVGAAEQAAINRWLLDHVAVISQAQLSNHLANTSIRTVCGNKAAYRGARMGRSCVLPLDEGGSAVDIKGCGIRASAKPSAGEYENGLLDLDKALEDYLKERLVDRALAYSGASFSVVHTLAIIDCGFTIQDAEGARGPAALCVRQAFPRSQRSDLPNYRSAEHRFSIETELLLRRCGITSCDSQFTITKVDGRLQALADQTDVYRDYPPALLEYLVDSLQLPLPFIADRINLQACEIRDGKRESFHLIDFGQYTVRNKFEFPILSLVANRPYSWGGLLKPDAEYFPQPNGTISSLWEPASVPADVCASRVLQQDGYAVPASLEFTRAAREWPKSPADLRESAENWLDKTTTLPRTHFLKEGSQGVRWKTLRP